MMGMVPHPTSDEAVGSVLAEVRDGSDALVQDVRDLIEIPSVSGSAAEGRIQDWIADRLRTLGLDVVTWRTPMPELSAAAGFPGSEVPRARVIGVLADLPGGEASSGVEDGLLLLGHSDVVPASDWPEAFTARRQEDRILGRGAADMKAGIAAAIHVARSFRKAGVVPANGLRVATVSGEEDGGCGTFDLLRRGLAARGCVIAEPTGGRVVVANAGALGFRITVEGQTAHAARRWEGSSALDTLQRISSVLGDLEAELNEDVDPVMSGWPIAYPTSIGTVTGGDWASTVMGTLHAEGRFGVPLGMSVADAKARFEAAIASTTGTDNRARGTVEWTGGQFAPARQNPNNPLVAAVAEAHRDITGRSARVAGTTYGSDMRLTLAAGIPTVLYGPGDPALSHTDREAVDLRDVVGAAQVIALAALRF